MAFHVKDGIYFERHDGRVHVFERTFDRDGNPINTVVVELTASQWASVMASVSRRGSETSLLHQEALDFHERPE